MVDSSSPTAFPSLSALRSAHSALLQAHREQGDSEAFFAAAEAFLRQGRATGALLDNEAERWTAQSLLDYWMATLLSNASERPAPADTILADFDPALAPELPDELCPYVGLDAFREPQSGIFFGRQRLAELLIDKLKAARLLAVVGPSGSGKSSLVLAGLVPALKQGAIPAADGNVGSEQWRYAPRMVPGSDPLANLARVLQSAGNQPTADQDASTWLANQVARLKADPHFLTTVVNETGDTPAVLVIDQFEELFTLCTDEEARQAFAANLLHLSQAADYRHTVILTMRTDFESFIMRLADFQPFFEQALVRVTPLNAAELREAIEKPAAAIGLKFEAGIVDALLQDILGEPAALPLLQFTLLKLWEARERNRITWAAYRRLGGGRLALARSADELYESLIPEEQVTTRRILLRLVRPSEGLEVTSNRVRIASLYQMGEAHDRVDRVLQRWIDARLLRLSEGDTSADRQVEVAHEALVRNWPRLVDWLDEERDRLRQRLRLTEAAEQWEKVERDPGALLRGALLDEALRYEDLNELEATFVEASQAAHVAAQQAEEEIRQRELQQAQAIAEEQRQRAETERNWAAYQSQIAAGLRSRAIQLSVISVMAVLLAIIAVISSWLARQNSIAAEVQRAVAQTANAHEINARQTIIAERDQGLNAQATLAANLEDLLNAQNDAQTMLDALLSATPLLPPPTPSVDVSGDEPAASTPTPILSEPVLAAVVAAGLINAYDAARATAAVSIDNVRAAQATATAAHPPTIAMVQTDAGSTATTLAQTLVFQVTAHDPAVGEQDGAGVEIVELQILNNADALLYARSDRTAPYCVFDDDGTRCLAWNFAEQDQRWPNGQPIRGGPHRLRAIAYGVNGQRATAEWTVTLQPAAAATDDDDDDGYDDDDDE